MVDRFSCARLVPVLMLAFLVAQTGFAQMDMLPQIFRDLPPELQEGLPEAMSYEEYRALNRNVDFFTMFMSIFVPGYGLFQVERPDLAWPMVGARFAGYGMMTLGVALQWNHFYDLVSTQELAADDFERLLVNGFIFGGGVVVAGLTWAGDVTLAYHIAKQEKDRVQYTYGIRAGLTPAGGPDAASEERYLRRMLEQPGEPRLVDLLLLDLPAYARRYPDAAFAPEALTFAALLAAELGRDPEALAWAVRAAHRYPGAERTPDALRLAARLLERNRGWQIDLTDAASLARLPVDDPPDARVLAGVAKLARLAGVTIAAGDAASGASASHPRADGSPTVSRVNRPLAEAALAEARAFLEQYAGGPLVDDGLRLTADLLLALDRPDEAAGYLAGLVVTRGGSPLWPRAALDLAELYLGELEDPDRARVLLEAIVEQAPDSAEAERARELAVE